MSGTDFYRSAIISIHALLAESDPIIFCKLLDRSVISIHALLAESDHTGVSTIFPACYFYPRSPCGERPLVPHQQKSGDGISIHALLAESDAILLPMSC